MKKQKTSEERLMELIDNPAMIQRAGKKKKQKSKLKLLFSSKFFTKENILKRLTLRNLNKTFFCFSVLVSVAFIVSLNSNRQFYDKKFHSISVVNPLLSPSSIRVKRLAVDFNESKQLSAERSIFSSAEKGFKSDQVTNDFANAAADITDISLVGVVWAGDQSQVLIEDNDLKTTFILSVGDKIKKFIVKEIMQDRAILFDGKSEYVFK